MVSLTWLIPGHAHSPARPHIIPGSTRPVCGAPSLVKDGCIDFHTRTRLSQLLECLLAGFCAAHCLWLVAFRLWAETSCQAAVDRVLFFYFAERWITGERKQNGQNVWTSHPCQIAPVLLNLQQLLVPNEDEQIAQGT